MFSIVISFCVASSKWMGVSVCLCRWVYGVRVVGKGRGGFSKSDQLFLFFGWGVTFWGCHGGSLSFGTLGGLKTFCFFLPGLSWRFFTSVWFMKALLALFSLLLVSYLVLLVWGFEMRQRTLFSPLIIVFWTSLWVLLLFPGSLCHALFHMVTVRHWWLTSPVPKNIDTRSNLPINYHVVK